MERRQRGHCVRHIYALIIFEMGKLFFDGLQTSALKTHPAVCQSWQARPKDTNCGKCSITQE